MINQGMQKRPQEHQKLQRENKNITKRERESTAQTAYRIENGNAHLYNIGAEEKIAEHQGAKGKKSIEMSLSPGNLE